MITNPQNTTNTPKAKKRSVFGLLFNPQLGPAISPLRESTRMFVHLLASVFAIYKVIPKDYPGLRDENARLSFSDILRTGWQNLRFTREGAPQTIMFLAVVGVMAISAFVAVSTILSLFIGHAHAQVDPSVFQAEGTSDLAQSWLNYLFNNPSNTALGDVSTQYPDPTTTTGTLTATIDDPFGGSQVLQKSLIGALAMYSDAILIVAAIILFYHLAAMVVETAHHGVPMGKRASQIWAPIRLVFAIGLLVPVSGGLSCGQFIIVKVAEMGSGLASHVWDEFLTQIDQNSGQTLSPGTTDVMQIAEDIILMHACAHSWNDHLQEYQAASMDFSGSKLILTSASDSDGTTYFYQGSTSTLADQGTICGSYFIPNGGNNVFLQKAVQAQTEAISSSNDAFDQAGAEISKVYDATPGQTITPITLSNLSIKAVQSYQTAVTTNLQSQLGQQQTQISATLDKMKPYGWVMAGAFLNTINRIQASVSGAVADSKPKTNLPVLRSTSQVKGQDSQENDIRKTVAKDLQNFGIYEEKSTQKNAGNLDGQCTAMMGLTAGSWGSRLASAPIDAVFYLIDVTAHITGLWSWPTTGASCGQGTTTPDSFQLGLQIKGHDPFAALASFGHASLNASGIVLTSAVITKIVAAGADGAADNIWTALPPVNPEKAGTKAILAGLDFIQPMIYFFSYIFWMIGFLLAFVVPLMPFMRFFFAVLSWVAAVIEAIIAIPLVALAHLNPEGEGLPGQAKQAYFYAFNLFLRPVLTIFGLICGIIIFMVAVSFLNYAFAIAVAGAGSTANGMDVVGKVIYTGIYVAIIYICANHSFQLIDHIPQKAMSWMGASGQEMAKMGDTDRIESLGGAGNALIAQRGAQSLGQGMTAGANKYKGLTKDESTKSGMESGMSGTPYNSLTQKQKDDQNFMGGYYQGLKTSKLLGDGSSGNSSSGNTSEQSPAEQSPAEQRQEKKDARDSRAQAARDNKPKPKS